MNQALDFLLKKKGPVPLIPFFRIVKGAGELGVEFAEAGAAGEFILEGGGLTTADALTGTDFYSPAIRKYESSALGSSRII
ncbi:hypothetical protein N9145_03715 [bacterium]|nr:hypothetical protein [bacterium]